MIEVLSIRLLLFFYYESDQRAQVKYLKQGFCAHRLIGLGAAYRFSLWLLFVICLPFVIPAISLYHSPFFRDHDELHYRGQHFRTSFSRSHQVAAYSARRHNHLLSVMLCLS